MSFLDFHKPLHSIFVIGLLAFSFPNHAFTQIVYFQPDEPIAIRFDQSPTSDWMIDINGDGKFDAQFRSESFYPLPDPTRDDYSVTTSFQFDPLGEIRFWRMEFDPTSARGLSEGEWIGPEAEWGHNSRTLIRRIHTTSREGETVSWHGSFFDRTTFLAFKLSIGDEDVLFGWIQLDGREAENFTLQVIDWAYNSEPNGPIQVGVIPEPTTVALFAGIVGFVFVLFHRQRFGRDSIGEPGGRGNE